MKKQIELIVGFLPLIAFSLLAKFLPWVISASPGLLPPCWPWS